MLLAIELTFGAVVFQNIYYYIADLVTRSIDRISPLTKSKSAKQLHTNSASSFGSTNKPPFESKAK